MASFIFRDSFVKNVVRFPTVNLLVRTLRQNRATAVATTLVLAVAAMVTWSLFIPHSDPRLNAIRQNGYPVTLSELDTWYRAVPGVGLAAR